MGVAHAIGGIIEVAVVLQDIAQQEIPRNAESSARIGTSKPNLLADCYVHAVSLSTHENKNKKKSIQLQ
jgi:hypothetical protein